MSEVEIKTRNDFQPELAKPSLPPTQKLAKDVWTDVFLLTLLCIALLATKWEIMTPADFGKAWFGILVVKAMSSGKGISLDALPFISRK